MILIQILMQILTLILNNLYTYDTYIAHHPGRG